MNNIDPKYIFPLAFGISLEDIHTKISKNFNYHHDRNKYVLTFNFMTIQEHPFDCGCLIIGGLNYCDKKPLSLIEKYASLSGYSKIIGTIRAKSFNQVFIKILQEANYTFIDTGPSSRHPEFNTWLIYKVIEPEIKGYI